jgi:hypothetical protein
MVNTCKHMQHKSWLAKFEKPTLTRGTCAKYQFVKYASAIQDLPILHYIQLLGSITRNCIPKYTFGGFLKEGYPHIIHLIFGFSMFC